jgi:uncharacterized protein (TIGR03437 family)
MKPIVWLSILAIIVVVRAAAQPQVAANGVLNAASNAPIGLPNSSIAQGSIFTIYGEKLGPSSSPALAYPLETTLAGVSVQVSSPSTALNAIPIFVGPTQINAILPDSMPTGPATLTVTHNGQTSNAVSFQVIANSFGIFVANFAAVITGVKNQVYSANLPAHPGDAATIWGTGIGASPGDDGSAPLRQIDMPNLPLSVYVGNQAATVTYRGRGGFTGEDQINFVVPAGITGCFVPVAVEIGNVVSNFVTMPIAPPGQQCPDPGMFYIDLVTGNITLARSTTIGTTTSTTDSGEANFGPPTTVSGNPFSLPAGTCTGGVLLEVIAMAPLPALDAGPAITITGPNGTKQLPSPLYSAQLGGGSGANPQPLYLNAGAYTVSGTGGTGVGPFSQNFTIPQPLTWTNQGNISSVDRSASLDISWTGGDPNGTVEIIASTGYASAFCSANISGQHFTIPAFVLLSLPPSSSASSSSATTSALTLRTSATTAFTASGISFGAISSIFTIQKNVTYQ